MKQTNRILYEYFLLLPASLWAITLARCKDVFIYFE